MPNVKWLHKFENWTDYVAAGHQPATDGTDSQRHSHYDHRDDWAGSTISEWRELEANGWDAIYPEIRELTDAVMDDIKPMLGETFTKRRGVRGQRVDMGKFLSGSPVCMSQIKPIKIATVGRLVTILINGGFSAGVDSSEIKRRGVAICALVEALDLAQHGTEIWIEVSMGGLGIRNNRDDRHVTLVRIKSAEEELNMARLMYAIAHPSALRRTWFAFVETLPHEEFRDFLTDGYGRPSENTQANAIEATIDLPLLRYPFPDALAWVRKHLATFGLIDEDD